MERFENRKKRYLRRLTEYADIVMELLCNNDTIREAAVLMDPRTNLELDFAISTLDYVDDMDKLLENISLGHIEKIDLNESLFVNYISELLKTINFSFDFSDIEKKMTVIQQNLITDEEEFLANMKYEFIIFSFIDPADVIEIIEKRSGFDLSDKYQRIKLDFVYELIKRNMEKSSEEDNYLTIINFNKKFHERCEKGIKEYTSHTVDKLIAEIFDDDIDNSSNVYKK